MFWSQRRVCESMSPENVQLVSRPSDAWSVIRWPVVWPWPKWNSDSGVIETKWLFSRRAFWSESVRKGAWEKIMGRSVVSRLLRPISEGAVLPAAIVSLQFLYFC